ncbi:MAG: response regulator [Spirochaetales bacterium]|nr:response regulator [Spirochaetales bacterium]
MDKIRILIVDDMKYVRDHITRILQEKYIVDTAASREDAIKKFQIAEKQNFTYDLILLDNYLPEPDAGIEVLEYIKENNINTIALMLSEHTNSECDPFKTGIKAFKAGAADFLTKPFKREFLEERITDLISKKRKALATIEMAENIGAERFKSDLEAIAEDGGIDMITRERAGKILNAGAEDFGELAFVHEPRDIEISDSPGKSHISMWNKRLRNIGDIPNDARIAVFDILARHKQIYRIKFGSFHNGPECKTYKLRIKSPKTGEGKLFCTLFGPSPINCTKQDFIIYVNKGFEEKVKKDIEKKIPGM